MNEGAARKLAIDLHALRFDIQDMAGDLHDDVGRWLLDVARQVEDMEFRAVTLAESAESKAP